MSIARKKSIENKNKYEFLSKECLFAKIFFFKNKIKILYIIIMFLQLVISTLVSHQCLALPYQRLEM
jgi:hypothetical protein